MQPERPIVVERDSSAGLIVVAIVVLAVLALVAGLVFANMDAIRGPNVEPGAGGQDNPSNPPTTMPEDDGILPTLPPIEGEGEGGIGEGALTTFIYT